MDAIVTHCMKEADSKHLSERGWVFLPGFLGRDPEAALMKFAEKLVGPVNCPPRGWAVKTLSPTLESCSRPKSLSRMFGLGSFPLHTDRAHWMVPSRLLLLGCLNPGQQFRRTLVLPVEDLHLEPKERRLLSGGVYLIRNGKVKRF